MVLIVLLLLALLGGGAALVAPRPEVHRLDLRQSIVPQGDDVLLQWSTRHATRITVTDAGGRRHVIKPEAWPRTGTTPLAVRTPGWLHIEISNRSHTVRRALGPVRLVPLPVIRRVTVADPDLYRTSDAAVAELSHALSLLAQDLPDWRAARLPHDDEIREA